MVENLKKIRIIALLSSDQEGRLRNQLELFGMSLTSVNHADELGHFVRNGECYQVALLPACLHDMDWWTIWGELGLLDQRPAILVYSPTASFQLWSGVLEAGGYDVLVEPISDERLKEALLRAAESFEQQNHLNGAG